MDSINKDEKRIGEFGAVTLTKIVINHARKASIKAIYSVCNTLKPRSIEKP
jgi:hypothetical protein